METDPFGVSRAVWVKSWPSSYSLYVWIRIHGIYPCNITVFYAECLKEPQALSTLCTIRYFRAMCSSPHQQRWSDALQLAQLAEHATVEFHRYRGVGRSNRPLEIFSFADVARSSTGMFRLIGLR